MRKVLVRFVFDQFWIVQSVGNELHVGLGWLLSLWSGVALGRLTWLAIRTRRAADVLTALCFWSIVPGGLLLLSRTDVPLTRTGIPIFGYGLMMFIGFAAGTLLAIRHAARVGIDSDVILDLILWLLVPGLLGARLFYVIQYSDRIFREARGLEYVTRFVAVWDGGLVFYGSVIGGILGGWLFCRSRNLRPLLMGDVVAPSLFVGLGFGRIGCFLYGCCYGGPSDLPWAVQFPRDSLTFQAQVQAGVIDPTAECTIPLHPTQIYSSLLAFLLAGILSWSFRRRPYEGFVVGLMFILYPVNRFVLELIRSDEQGQLGTSLTISQLISVGLFISGVSLLVWLSKTRDPIPSAEQRARTG